MLTVMAVLSVWAYAQDYSNAAVQASRLQALAKDYSQLASLRSVGCDRLQGYLFSPPLELDVVAGWLGSIGAGSFDALVAAAAPITR